MLRDVIGSLYEKFSPVLSQALNETQRGDRQKQPMLGDSKLYMKHYNANSLSLLNYANYSFHATSQNFSQETKWKIHNTNSNTNRQNTPDVRHRISREICREWRNI